MPKKVFVRLFDFKVDNIRIETDDSDNEESKRQKKFQEKRLLECMV